MKKGRYFVAVINIVLPLLAGLCIYIIFRPNTYVSRLILPLLKDTGIVPFQSCHPVWTILSNYGCDFLWAYALTFAVFFVMDISAEKPQAAAGISAIFSVFLELTQLGEGSWGTFDILDIFVEVLACLLGAVIIYCILGRKKHEIY